MQALLCIWQSNSNNNNSICEFCDFYVHTQCISLLGVKYTNSTLKCDRWKEGYHRPMTEGKTICPPPLRGGDIKTKHYAGSVTLTSTSLWRQAVELTLDRIFHKVYNTMEKLSN